MYRPMCFLKTDLCYMFLNEKQKFNLKTQIENAWNLNLHGCIKMAVTHFVTQFTHVYGRKLNKIV